MERRIAAASQQKQASTSTSHQKLKIIELKDANKNANKNLNASLHYHTERLDALLMVDAEKQGARVNKDGKQPLNNMPTTTKLIDGLRNTLAGLNECKLKVQEIIKKWKHIYGSSFKNLLIVQMTLSMTTKLLTKWWIHCPLGNKGIK